MRCLFTMFAEDIGLLRGKLFTKLLAAVERRAREPLVPLDLFANRVMGADVITDYRRARRMLGVVPQELVFDPFFSVRETLRFQSGYFGLRDNDATTGVVTVASARGMAARQGRDQRPRRAAQQPGPTGRAR